MQLACMPCPTEPTDPSPVTSSTSSTITEYFNRSPEQGSPGEPDCVSATAVSARREIRPPCRDMASAGHQFHSQDAPNHARLKRRDPIQGWKSVIKEAG